MKTEMVLHGKTVTREAMLEFKKAYMKALKQQRQLFEVDGQQVMTSYAKYVVEYAETQLGVLK